MSKQTEALKMALSTLANARDWVGNDPEGRWDEDEMYDELCNMVKFVSEALADSALDRMAENARELGLDYEPPCKTGSQCTSKCQHCDEPHEQLHCNDCGGFDPECPLVQPAQPSKPLTDEQIMEMYNEPRSDAEMLEFARAIEAAHGIKGSA